MDLENDGYKTITEPFGPVLFKEKKSKFIGYAFPLDSEGDVRPHIEGLRKKYPAANHVCHAWQIGVEEPRYRAQDDGEPNNSAGLPIYGQIQAFGVTNILIAVVRIFGGTKLGVGGLVSSYRTAAQMALEASTIMDKTVQQLFELEFGYEDMDRVMRSIKQSQITLVSQTMTEKCGMTISVRKSESAKIEDLFNAMYPVKILKKK
ncbi:MAG: YigZ family protein [Sediminicola sp.]|tara:strand:- start:21579 stop:22193 length:615 start_codon:yes stop_codon:yes gene_type:complete